MITDFQGAPVPAVHPDLLVVKTRPPSDGGMIAAAAARGDEIAVPEGSPGLELLHRLEERGEVTAVYDLDAAAGEGAGSTTDAVSALAFTAAGEGVGSQAGSLVQVAPGAVDDLREALEADPDVEFAAPVAVRAAMVDSAALERRIDGRLRALEARRGEAADGPAAPWNLRRIRLAEALALGVDQGADVRVGVLDTGVDAAHPDLAGLIEAYDPGVAAVEGGLSDQDVVGHGTHVSGVIGARFDAGVGFLGVSAARPQVWKIFGDTPKYIERGGLYWYLVDPLLYRRALADCAEKVDVLNLSIGGTKEPDPQESALFDLLAERGVHVVAAMGNERAAGNRTSYPAAIPGVVAVGATGPDDRTASFSNTGEHIALSAPGVSIWSTLPTYPGQIGYRASFDSRRRPKLGLPIPRDTGHAAMDGTSMASPHVAGAAALVLANAATRPDRATLRELLMGSADRTPEMSGQRWSADVGAGRLNLERLMLAVTRL